MRELYLSEIHHVSGANSSFFAHEKYLLTNYPFFRYYPAVLFSIGTAAECAILGMAGFHLAGPLGGIVGTLIVPTWIASCNFPRRN